MRISPVLSDSDNAAAASCSPLANKSTPQNEEVLARPLPLSDECVTSPRKLEGKTLQFSQSVEDFEYPACIRQRAHEQRKKLPKRSRAPNTRCAIPPRLLYMVFKEDPQRTRCMMRKDPMFKRLLGELVREKYDSDMEKTKLAVKQCRSLTLWRHKVKHSSKPAVWEYRIALLKQQWKREQLSIREISRRTLGAYDESHIRWALKAPTCNANPRRITKAQRDDVTTFFRSSVNSISLPYKRYSRYFYLRASVKALYQKYRSSRGDAALSISSVRRILLHTKLFKCMRKIPYLECLCVKCENFRMVCAACVLHGVKCVETDPSKTLLQPFCHPNKTSFYPRVSDLNFHCVKGVCSECRGLKRFEAKFKAANSKSDQDKLVNWRQWKKTKVPFQKKGETIAVDRWQIQTTRDKLSELVKLFWLQLSPMATHQYTISWQAEQQEQAKGSLKEGDVYIVCDFAKNRELKRPREIQYAFYTKTEFTLHPVVCVYLCGCGKQIRHDVLVVSPDTKHDGHAVQAFLTSAINVLLQEGRSVQRIIRFTDNCAGQYKSVTPLNYLLKNALPIEYHFTAAGHGKGVADQAIGLTTQCMDAITKGGLEPIESVREYYRIAQHHLTIGTPTTAECLHSRRSFVYVHSVRRLEHDFDTLQRITCYHSLQRSPRDATSLCCRELSCFCPSCREQKFSDCENRDKIPLPTQRVLPKISQTKKDARMFEHKRKELEQELVGEAREKAKKKTEDMKKAHKLHAKSQSGKHQSNPGITCHANVKLSNHVNC